MEQKVKFAPGQEVPSSEMNFLQDQVQVAIQRVVQRLLIRSEYYYGLTVTKNSATEIAIDAGTFWASGMTFQKDAATTQNLTAYFPVGLNLKKIAVVASGTTVDTDAAPRKFVVDPNTGAVRPRTVDTRVKRQVVISIIEGTEGLVAPEPVVPLGYAWISTIELSSTGIVGDPVAVTDQIAPNLEDTIASLQILQQELDIQLGMIRTLRSDFAALAQIVRHLAPQRDIDRIDQELLMIREKVDIPDLAVFYGYDLFESDSESDTGHGSYNASVGAGGLKLPQATPTSQLVALLNPTDARVITHSNGITLPAYTEVVRFQQDTRRVGVSLASYAVVTRAKRKKGHGWMFKWHGYRHECLWEALKRNVEAKPLLLMDPVDGLMVSIPIWPYPWQVPVLARQWGRWLHIQDWKPYWRERYVLASVTGYTIAQTFLSSQGGWLTGISLNFRTKGPSGDVRIIICETATDGTPDLDNALEEVTLPYASIRNDGFTKVAIPAVHVGKGVRIAYVIQSDGAHTIWASDTNVNQNGTLWYATDATRWASTPMDLDVKLYFAQFTANLVNVELEAVSRVGGIDALDFTFTGVRPDGVDMDVQAQVAGVWRNLDSEDPTALATGPNLIPLRLSWQNTKDDAVGIVLTASRVQAYKSALAGVHISTARTLPNAATTALVTVKERLRGYDDGQHTHAIKLLHGGAYGSTKTADTTEVVDLANGDKEFRATFDFTGAEIDTYKVRTEMGITTSDAEYVTLDRWDHAT